MIPRERLSAALRHQPPDRVPLDIGGSYATGINTRAYDNLEHYLGSATPSRVASQRSDIAWVEEPVRAHLGIDTYPLLPGSPDGAVIQLGAQESAGRGEGQGGPESYRDEWGVVRRRAHGGHYYVEEPPLARATLGDLATYPWPNPDDPGWARGLAEEAQRVRAGTGYGLVLSLPVGFGHQCQFLRGYEAWLIDCAADPRFAGALMDRVLDVHLQVAEHLLAAVGDLVDVVLYADDMGFQDRPIVSPAMFRKLIAPRQKRFLQFVRARTGAKVLYHTCGAVASLIPLFIDAGVHVLNPVQTTAAGMDPAWLKREFGRDLAFWGGVDTQHLLPYGSPAEVARAVRGLVEVLGAGGGFVLSAANNIQADTPPANVVAMAAALTGTL
jgi:uroporphyrinogen decarboxylase